MIDRLIQWLWIDLPKGVQSSQLRFEWGSLPQGQRGLALALVALALVAMTIALYRREGAASTFRKTALAVLRLLVLAIAAVVILEPRLARDVERKREAVTIVLWDESLSMSIPDRYHDPARRAAVAAAAGIKAEKLAETPRADVAAAIVQRAGLVGGLAARNKVKLYAFGDDVRAIQALDAKDLAPKAPATDMARAARKALEEHGGVVVAAVVAVTDGRSNKGEGLRAVGAMLKERGGDRGAVPFYAIGIGDPQAPKNIEVAELAANERAYKNDPLVLEARVRARGFQGEKVDVELHVAPREDASRSEKVEAKALVLPADGASERVSFDYVPKQTGELIFTVRIAPREEEPVPDDNQRSVAVSVIDDETKVLLVASGPTFEVRGIKNLLLREKTVKLTLLLESASGDYSGDGRSTLIRSMPRTKEDLFAFDVVVLFDPSPRILDGDVLDLLVKFVGDHGGGLLFVAGDKWTGALLRGPESKPLVDLLPVRPDADRAAEWAQRTFVEPLRFKTTDEADDHPVTRLDHDQSRSRAIWQHLPPVFWYFPVAQEKAGATVLLRTDDPRAETARGATALIAAHFFGPGRTLWFGVDESWRWKAVARRAYERLWVQALRFLVEGRLLGGRRRLELSTDKDEYALGEPVRVRLRALDKSYRPIEAPELEVQSKHEGGETGRVILKKAADRAGAYEGTFVPHARGTFEVQAKGLDTGPEEKPSRKTIRVRLPDLEFSNPRLDEEALREVAEETKGELVLPGDVAKLAEKIPPRTEILRVPAEPIPLWDRPPILAVIVTLLAIEWFIRKRSRMV